MNELWRPLLVLACFVILFAVLSNDDRRGPPRCW